MIEPVIQEGAPAGPNAALFSTFRPDLWPSRSAAEDSFRKNKVFQRWDPRALDKYLQYGLRETPTTLYPHESKSGPVTLTTTKHQEAWSYVRSNFISRPDESQTRLVVPDLNAENSTHLFHAPQMVQTWTNLPHVRPNILWVFGELSPINTLGLQEEKMRLTGTGVGGSGGAKAGRVQKELVKKGGHMLPFEKVGECASALALWLGKQMEDFELLEEFHREHSNGRSERDMLVVSKLWLENVRLKPREKSMDKAKI